MNERKWKQLFASARNEPAPAPPEAFATDALRAIRRAIRCNGIGHEEAPEAVRMELDGRGHRVFVSRDAGDERGLGHAIVVQFLFPACREIFARRGDAPVQRAAYFGDGLAAFGRQPREKRGREKVNVRVTDGEITPGS